MTTTTTAPRFTLDEDKAREWLDKIIAANEQDDYAGELLPEINGNWQAADPGNEDSVFLLVRHAVDGEIIGRPNGNYDLDFEYVDDSDGGYYYFLIRIGYGLKLASHAYEMRKIDGRDDHGLSAALAILREAVRSANGVLSDLDEYVAAQRGA